MRGMFGEDVCPRVSMGFQLWWLRYWSHDWLVDHFLSKSHKTRDSSVVPLTGQHIVRVLRSTLEQSLDILKHHDLKYCNTISTK